MFSRTEIKTDGPRERGQHTSIPPDRLQRSGCDHQGGGAPLSYTSFMLCGCLCTATVTPQCARNNWEIAVASGEVA